MFFIFSFILKLAGGARGWEAGRHPKVAKSSRAAGGLLADLADCRPAWRTRRTGGLGLADLADWRTWRTLAGGLGGLADWDWRTWRTRKASLADLADCIGALGGLGGLWTADLADLADRAQRWRTLAGFTRWVGARVTISSVQSVSCQSTREPVQFNQGDDVPGVRPVTGPGGL